MTDILSSPYTYAIIIAVAAFVAAYGSLRISKTRDRIAEQTENLVQDAQKTLNELQNVGEGLKKNISETEKTNSKLEENRKSIIESLEKSLEAKDAALKSKDEIIGMLTGGDSKPRILYNDEGFLLAILGDYGIPNLRLDIVYISNYESTNLECLSDYLNYSKTSQNIKLIYSNKFDKTWAGTMQPLSLSGLDIKLDKNTSHGFDFIINSEFKRWIQRVRLIPNGDKWEVLDGLEEEKTFRKNKELPSIETIHFKMSKDFPYVQKVNGVIYGSNRAYYMLDNEKLNEIGCYNLFSRGFEMKEEDFINSISMKRWK